MMRMSLEPLQTISAESLKAVRILPKLSALLKPLPRYI